MTKKSPISVVREDIRALAAYQVQNADNLVKLDAMENPFELPDVIQQKWLEKAAHQAVNRYPDSGARALKSKLADLLGLHQDLDILFGNGSDEILQILMMAVARPGASVLSVEPGFVMYKMIAKFCGVDFVGVDLEPDFSLPVERLEQSIEEHQPSLLFLALPNNPTGNVFEAKAVERIIEAMPGVVVIDEAYTAFTDFDGQYLLKKYPNVVVLRTFSKMGLAGLRLGYLLGEKSFLDELNKLRMPYNINVLSQSMAECVLDHYPALEQQAANISRLRADLYRSLQGLPDMDLFESEANFITVRIRTKSARELAQALKNEGVLIKVLDGSHPLLGNCLRFTVGTEQENNQLLEALHKHL